jgi:hypothetical protein
MWKRGATHGVWVTTKSWLGLDYRGVTFFYKFYSLKIYQTVCSSADRISRPKSSNFIFMKRYFLKVARAGLGSF